MVEAYLGASVNLWIDDLRPPPDETWVWAKTSTDAKSQLASHTFEKVSFDHDLGGDDTSRSIVLFMINHDLRADSYSVHSANPVGAEWLNGMIERYLIP